MPPAAPPPPHIPPSPPSPPPSPPRAGSARLNVRELVSDEEVERIDCRRREGAGGGRGGSDADRCSNMCACLFRN